MQLRFDGRNIKVRFKSTRKNASATHFFMPRAASRAVMLGVLTLSSWLGQASPVQAAYGWQNTFAAKYFTPVSSHRNNVFMVGEPISFNFGPNASRFEVRDYEGNLVDSGNVAGGAIADGGLVKVSAPGWYKLYSGWETDQGAPFGKSLGSTTFCIWRNDAHFAPLPPKNTPSGSAANEDNIMRGLIGGGPQRFSVGDAANPDAAIAALAPRIATAKQYQALDPARRQPLLIAFPNGTRGMEAGVTKIAQYFQNDVEYWETRNEPNQTSSAGIFVWSELKPFYAAIKGVNPRLKVLGPGVVAITPPMLEWLNDFFVETGASCIDAFSFHAYNTVNGDMNMARRSLDALNALLVKYNVQNIEKWQTEQGYFAAHFGVYQPRLQGRWTMVQMLAFEQAGLPKEHNAMWYDKSHGFWDYPCWWENEDGSLNPGAALTRVWSEELWGTNHKSAYNFGVDGQNLYAGSLFEGTQSDGSAKRVAVFLNAGNGQGQIQLRVSGGTSLKTVSAFGVEGSVSVLNGLASLTVPEVPVYVELAPGQNIEAVPIEWGPDLALMPGTTAVASGGTSHPMDATYSNNVSKIVNGQLEDWYYAQGTNSDSWFSNVDAFPATVEVRLPVVSTIDHVVIYAGIPWQWRGSLLDYDLQYDDNGTWKTLETVQEPSKTFRFWTPAVRCKVDTFYSERSIFEHRFTPVKTSKIRLVVRDVTWGGGATLDVVQEGGQTGPHQICLREIEVYGSTNPTPAITGRVITRKGLAESDVPLTMVSKSYPSPAAKTLTNAQGSYRFGGLLPNGSYQVTPLLAGHKFSPLSRTATVAVDTALDFSDVTGDGTGLKATYYDVENLTAPKLTRLDSTINFDWGEGSPDPRIAPYSFSTRWTGQIEAPYGETYTFSTVSDDGARLWINGQLLIDDWNWHLPTEKKGTITLEAGKRYDIKLEYRQGNGGSSIKLLWTSPSIAREIVPQSQLYPSKPPTAILTAPQEGATITAPTQLTLGADAIDVDGTVSRVEFFNGNIKLGEDLTAPYTFMMPATNPATLRLWARAWDNDGLSGDSILVNAQIVATPNLKPEVQLLSPADGASYALGTAIGFYAEALDRDGKIAKVEFFANDLKLAQATLDPYQWTWSSAPAGRYALTAVATDDRGATTTSNIINISVNAPAPTAVPTPTVAPTPTTAPTSTPIPTPTAQPTATPVPTATQAPAAGTTAGGTGLTGSYYDVENLTGLKLTRLDPTLNFDWREGSPSPLIAPYTFSTRWTGFVQPLYDETYTLSTVADDGVRFWLDGNLIIDDWTWHNAIEKTAVVPLKAGFKHAIKIEYKQGYGSASMKLLWSSPSQARQIIPTSQLYPAAVPGS